VSDDPDEVDRGALAATFPAWDAPPADRDEPRDVVGEVAARTRDEDADSWLNELVDRHAERTFLKAFPGRTDVSPYDRVACGMIVVELQEQASRDPRFLGEPQRTLDRRLHYVEHLNRDNERAARAHAQSVGEKAEHVRRATQTREHRCHWPGCTRQCKPAMWGCFAHWRALPQHLRDKIWRSYRVGQEVTRTPSREYLAVADEVDAWIRERGGGR
jgi:hypothetical protein